MTEQERNHRAEALKNMDKAIRYVNDEENGVMDTWLEEGVPDESTDMEKEKCPDCGQEMTIWEQDVQRPDGFYNHDVPFWYCLHCKKYHGMVIC